jgi:hypothetical protein
MMKAVIALHDQATELSYPASLKKQIDLLFGPVTRDFDKSPNHVISIRETAPERFSVTGDAGRRVGDELSTAALLDVLLEEIIHSLIFELDTAVALHSSSVAWRDHSILIPGPTGAGKTSLTGWFAAKGFEFLSDEIVILPGSGKTTLSFPRPLLAKPGAEQLIALLTGRGQIVRTGANTLIILDHSLPRGKLQRQAGLIIFPNFVAGSELEFTSLSPAKAAMRLMECNLNARNLADHGLGRLTAFSREVPALTLTYGSYEQLDGVADNLAKFVLDNQIGVAGLQVLATAFRGPPTISQTDGSNVPSTILSAPVQPKAAIPEATPRKPPKKITIGMATYDDYDGVYFSLQAIRLYHPEILDDTEFLVIDNHPDGPCGQALKGLENSIPNYRYVPKSDVSGTAIRDCVFEEAGGEIVLCMDCHVFFVKGALKRLVEYFDAHPGSRDLVQGPLLYDDLKSLSTHFKPEWRGGMYGIWATSDAGTDPDKPPFEITMQGLGVFACRREAWPGFNPAFRGFGGEEGYIHEKFRQRGGRALCLPSLQWMHRFNRPMGIPYPNRWEDRVRNYFIGFRELGWHTEPIAEHFKTLISEETIKEIMARTADELERCSPAAASSPERDTSIATDRPTVVELPAPKPDRPRVAAAPAARDPFASAWDVSALAQQRQLLQRIMTIAESQQLALYLYWGTLLGHIRQGGILPWDDDVDLAWFDPSREQYDGFRAAIEAAGLQVFDRADGTDFWIKICDPSAPVQSLFPWTWPFVDIFIYSVNPQAAGGSYPVTAYPVEILLPGRITTFEGVRCWEPEQPLAVLDIQYADWRTCERSSHYRHRFEKIVGNSVTRLIETDQHGRKIRNIPIDCCLDTAEPGHLLSREAFLPLLRRWIDLCKQHNVPYSIFWGTLLGQMRNQRIIPYDEDLDVVVGRAGVDRLYALAGKVPGCVFNDELKDQPLWKEREIRLVVRRDLVSPDGPRFDHRGERVSKQVDSCSFNGPLARLIIKLPLQNGREYWHLDVDMFTDISHFNHYPALHEVDELPELEERPLEGLWVSCLKDPLPYILDYYGADYMTPDHVYREGHWVASR